MRWYRAARTSSCSRLRSTDAAPPDRIPAADPDRFPQPYPATRGVPQWLKDMPMERPVELPTPQGPVNTQAPTVKQCPPNLPQRLQHFRLHRVPAFAGRAIECL